MYMTDVVIYSRCLAAIRKLNNNSACNQFGDLCCTTMLVILEIHNFLNISLWSSTYNYYQLIGNDATDLSWV